MSLPSRAGLRESTVSHTVPFFIACRMNIFRFAGDMSHLASFFLLGWRLWEKKNANGASPGAPATLRRDGEGRRRAAARCAQRPAASIDHSSAIAAQFRCNAMRRGAARRGTARCSAAHATAVPLVSHAPSMRDRAGASERSRPAPARAPAVRCPQLNTTLRCTLADVLPPRSPALPPALPPARARAPHQAFRSRRRSCTCSSA